MSERRDTATLSSELEQALVRELSRAYDELNQTHFKGALKKPQLALSDATQFLGRYFADPRLIEISRPMILSSSWGVVIDVLKHELAHQYVHEVLRVDESPHGPLFRALCERLGIDARARGLPEASAVDPAKSRLLERVARLLALAESDNQHEAEAAAALAQKLLLQHNLTLPHDGPARVGYRHVGRVTRRVSEWERRLAGLLEEHFFVEVIWVGSYLPCEGKRGSVLEVVGPDESLELASYVYDFMVRTAERLWLAHKAREGLSGNRDRMAYFAGVMSGFAGKLRTQAQVSKAEGLVWVPTAELHSFMRKRHPYIRTVRTQGHRSRDAFAQGQQAGHGVVLHRGLHHGPSGHTRLLTSGS